MAPDLYPPRPPCYDDMEKEPLTQRYESDGGVVSRRRRLSHTLVDAEDSIARWWERRGRRKAPRLTWQTSSFFLGCLVSLTSLVAVFTLWHVGEVLDTLPYPSKLEWFPASSDASISHLGSPGNHTASTNDTASATSSTKAAPTSFSSSTTKPRTDNIALILKTGSATLYDRLPIHLQEGFLSYNQPEHVMFVSDITANMSGVEIWDALAGVSETIASDESFSQLYSQVQDLWSSHQSLTNTENSKDGWELDKYKFIPMMAEAWRRFPDADWFVAVEADTFVFFNQLVTFLQAQDPHEQMYLGRRTYVDFDGASTVFAHGGAGFVVSRALMEVTFGTDPDFEHQHDDLILNTGFGDAILAKVFWDAEGTEIHDLQDFEDIHSDMFHGDGFRDVPIELSALCTPVATYHHVSNADIASLYALYRELSPKLPQPSSNEIGNYHHLILHIDIWNAFAPPPVQAAVEALSKGNLPSAEVVMAEWQALDHSDDDGDLHMTTTANSDDCQALCGGEEDCLMWTFFPKENEKQGDCKTAYRSIRIGQRRSTSSEESAIMSGWRVGRISKWIGQTDCSERPLMQSQR